MRYFRSLFPHSLFVFVSAILNDAPPSLVVEPVDTVAGYSSDNLLVSVTLNCEVRPQDAAVSWYKDDVRVKMAEIPIVETNGGLLTVGTRNSSVDGAVVEGLYYCIVENGVGAVRSRTALVKVQGLKKFFQHSGNNAFYVNEPAVVAQIGYTIQPQSDSLVLWTVQCQEKKLTCNRTQCPFWQHSFTAGRLLLYSILLVRFSEIEKSISVCGISDTVSIAAQLGHRPSALPVYDKIKFSRDIWSTRSLLEDQSIAVEVGSNTSLYCIGSHPNGTYTWKKDKSVVDLSRDRRFSIGPFGILHIQTVVEEDSGQYDCVYTFLEFDNKRRTRTKTTDLMVYALPSVAMTMIQVNDKHDATVCRAVSSLTTQCSLNLFNRVVTVLFVCTVTGLSPLVVQVFKDARLLHEGNASYSLSHTIHSPSSGIYQCVATNQFGSQQTSMYLNVEGTSVKTDEPITTEPSLHSVPVTSNMPSRHSESSLSPSESTLSPVSQDEGTDSAIALTAAAAVGWVLMAVLLSVVIVLIILRKRGEKTYDPSQPQPSGNPNSGDLMENAAYNVVLSHHAVNRTLSALSAEYIEILDAAPVESSDHNGYMSTDS